MTQVRSGQVRERVRWRRLAMGDGPGAWRQTRIHGMAEAKPQRAAPLAMNAHLRRLPVLCQPP